MKERTIHDGGIERRSQCARTKGADQRSHVDRRIATGCVVPVDHSNQVVATPEQVVQSEVAVHQVGRRSLLGSEEIFNAVTGEELGRGRKLRSEPLLDDLGPLMTAAPLPRRRQRGQRAWRCLPQGRKRLNELTTDIAPTHLPDLAGDVAQALTASTARSVYVTDRLGRGPWQSERRDGAVCHRFPMRARACRCTSADTGHCVSGKDEHLVERAVRHGREIPRALRPCDLSPFPCGCTWI